VSKLVCRRGINPIRSAESVTLASRFSWLPGVGCLRVVKLCFLFVSLTTRLTMINIPLAKRSESGGLWQPPNGGCLATPDAMNGLPRTAGQTQDAGFHANIGSIGAIDSDSGLTWPVRAVEICI
jgi:hypothetical protein